MIRKTEKGMHALGGTSALMCLMYRTLCSCCTETGNKKESGVRTIIWTVCLLRRSLCPTDYVIQYRTGVLSLGHLRSCRYEAFGDFCVFDRLLYNMLSLTGLEISSWEFRSVIARGFWRYSDPTIVSLCQYLQSKPSDISTLHLPTRVGRCSILQTSRILPRSQAHI